MKKIRFFASLRIFLVLFGLSFLLFNSCERNKQQVEATKQLNAPDFSLPLVNASGVATLSENIGKVIILDFWATWCPPCRMEIPGFIELYNKYKDSGLIVIGISVDDSVDTVNKFIIETNINYPVVMGNSKVVQDYGGITGIPTTFIIDRKGNIVQRFIGYRPKDVFENEIKKLLSEET